MIEKEQAPPARPAKQKAKVNNKKKPQTWVEKIHNNIKKDFFSIVIVLVLLFLLLLAVDEGQDAVNKCDERYRPLVEDYNERTGATIEEPTYQLLWPEEEEATP